jgi:hypothetical protein
MQESAAMSSESLQQRPFAQPGCWHHAGPRQLRGQALADVLQVEADVHYRSYRYGLLLSPSTEEFVFYQLPFDVGGVGVVSAQSGLSVFGGGIIWTGTGDIVYPTTWCPVSGLGAGVSPPPRPSAYGFDLAREFGRSDFAVPQEVVDDVVGGVWSTALPSTLARYHAFSPTVVLLYPRTVGDFNPSKAEWIVFINSMRPR